MKQSTGLQRQQCEAWRKTLLQCLANVEAVIDFGEDENIAEEVAEQVLPRVQHLGRQLQHHLTSGEHNIAITCKAGFAMTAVSWLPDKHSLAFPLPIWRKFCFLWNQRVQHAGLDTMVTFANQMTRGFCDSHTHKTAQQSMISSAVCIILGS